MITVGSLFSGIGGIDLGLERAGMTVKWQSEIEPYSCRVLAKHWPDVPNLGNIKEVNWEEVERVDVIAGGYPCQPFSTAGKRNGSEDPRHLWPEMLRAISVLRPRVAFLENVRGHYSLGFDCVLGDLADIGYDCEWEIVSAQSVGAPHRRERLICLAYPNGGRLKECQPERKQIPRLSGSSSNVAYTDSGDTPNGGQCESLQGENQRWGDDSGRGRGDTGKISLGGTRQDSCNVADTKKQSSDGEPDYFRDSEQPETVPKLGDCGRSKDVADTNGSLGEFQREREVSEFDPRGRSWWEVEPDVGRVAHGIPSRVDRLRGLGNAVVPQVAEVVGRVIMEMLTPV